MIRWTDRLRMRSIDALTVNFSELNDARSKTYQHEGLSSNNNHDILQSLRIMADVLNWIIQVIEILSTKEITKRQTEEAININYDKKKALVQIC